MIAVLWSALLWYVLITLIGWLAFPLVFRLFSGLPSRGYALSRTLGLLLWGWLFWLPASLHLLYNNAGGLLLALGGVAALSAWAWRGNEAALRDFLQENRRFLLGSELVFGLFFAFMVLVRAAVPAAVGTEKPMELAFISAILRSPTLPPHDPWLSGYAISYYYFGYLMAAMLARLTAVTSGVAFNLMLALVFGLAAQGSYGLVYDLLRLKDIRRPDLALLGPFFLLISGNVEGLLEVLHRRGLFWTESGFNFWRWLDMKELSQPPMQPFGWIPDRFWFWWRASRVVQDYDMTGRFLEVIDEFPSFSFVLGDLHPHVMAIPFLLLAIGLALHLFTRETASSWELALPLLKAETLEDGRRVWRWERRALGALLLSPAEFLLMALLAGGLAFLNTWDILTGGVLLGGAYLLGLARRDGWRAELIDQAILLGVPLLAAALLFYFPFYVGFDSQAGGLAPNLINPTRGAHLWVMFGTLFVPLFAFFGWLWRQGQVRSRDLKAAAAWLGLALVAFLALDALLVLAARLQNGLVPDLLIMQGYAPDDVGGFLFDAALRRWDYAGGLLTLLALGMLLLARLLVVPRRPQVEGFLALLAFHGLALVLAVEFVYLRDQFGTRMNTVFKFYYQAWIVWSVVAASGAALLLHSLQRWRRLLWQTGLSLVLITGLVYPLLAYPNRTNNFRPPEGWTLDAAAFLERQNPDEGLAVRWLRSVPLGVLAEAVGGSYSQYARVSMVTGLPTVIGWPGHELQWRGSAEPLGTRQQDIAMLYETRDWDTAWQILQRYNIRYVYVGPLERSTYRVFDEKFRLHGQTYSFGSVVIYEFAP